MKWNNEDLFCHDLPTSPKPGIGRILVTGATGYIGGRLVPELLERGYEVRVMVRAISPELKDRWPDAEIVKGDALEPVSLRKALKNIHTAYYLIHSLLLGKKKFESADLLAAVNFRKVAEEKNIKKIIYLGGLGTSYSSLSPHLRSRLKVEQKLKQSKIPTVILRAAIIIGSGSASYEIIKNLVKSLPVLFIPNWANTKCQPIGIRDVIKYLVGVLEIEETAENTFDIGGNEILTYKSMLKTLADVMCKKRVFIPSPISNIRIFSYLTSLLTPVPASITMCLMEGIRNEVICQDCGIMEYLPFEPLSYKEAIIRAMTREERDKIHTRWSDAYPPAHELAIKLHELARMPRYSSSYSLTTGKDPSRLFRNICKIGGKEGWFHNNWLWRTRGMIDRLLMGVGSSRGRRSNSKLRMNDVIGFWRVENLKQNELLLLRAEMKLPGKAWLKFKISPEGEKNVLSIHAYYHTHTLFGKMYWFSVLPFHTFIFYGLIKEIERRS